MAPADKPLVWLHGEVKSPPLSREGRREAGLRLRQLQKGIALGMPHSRPMPAVGVRCHELRVRDRGRDWRLMYRIDSDAVLVLDVFEKKTQKTPRDVIDACQRRLRQYERAAKEG